MLEQELYERAIKMWGKIAQVDVAIEEMAELTQALCKIKRKTQPNEITYNVYEEIADVEIMLEQLKVIFDREDMVLAYKDQKLERLEKRVLDAEKKENPGLLREEMLQTAILMTHLGLGYSQEKGLYEKEEEKKEK